MVVPVLPDPARFDSGLADPAQPDPTRPDPPGAHAAVPPDRAEPPEPARRREPRRRSRSAATTSLHDPAGTTAAAKLPPAPRLPRNEASSATAAAHHPSIDALPRGIPLPLAPLVGSTPCPLASTSVAAGFPSPADDYVEARIDLNLELIPRPLSTFFMRVRGDAMTGDGILDGDLLVIDRSVEARPGLVVVATHGGAFIVRRLQAQRGDRSGLLVASDGVTPALKLGEDAELWGVVIHAVHHLAGAPSRRR